jgi:anaerobic ribonucleoside-triphosphate reductase activating protein
MKIYLASKIQFDSIVDGTGLRSVIWFQGCTHNCPGCQNPQTHSFKGGFEIDIDDIINEILSNSMQTGVTLSGGDPFFQYEGVTEITKILKEQNINIWCYTGFKFEELIKKQEYNNLLQYINVLVDGPYIESLKSYDLKFKGSSNQRIIDVQKSLQENKIILWE